MAPVICSLAELMIDKKLHESIFYILKLGRIGAATDKGRKASLFFNDCQGMSRSFIH